MRFPNEPKIYLLPNLMTKLDLAQESLTKSAKIAEEFSDLIVKNENVVT